MRVAVTGGDGLIGGILRRRLPDRFATRFLTRADAELDDLPALEGAFAGADAVVHLAANADNGADWSALLEPNVIGAYHAFEAARRAGVERVGTTRALPMPPTRPRSAPTSPFVPIRCMAPRRPGVKPWAGSTRSATGCASSVCVSAR